MYKCSMATSPIKICAAIFISQFLVVLASL
jgi:hypothetical protein